MDSPEENVTRLNNASRQIIAQQKSRKRIGAWLRSLADYLESGETETDPFSALVTLVGREQMEVLVFGLSAQVEISEAATTTYRHAVDPQGERNHGVYPRNIGQFIRDFRIVQAHMAKAKPE